MSDSDPSAESNEETESRAEPLSEPSEPEPGDDTWPTGVSPSLFPDPERIGRFVVRRRIGAGGMGIVYAAHDEELDRTVAIKLLLHDAPGRERSRLARRDRLRREAQILARLSHANVVPVYEVGEHDGSVFVVMEYVRGTTLQAWVEEDEPAWRDVLQAYLEAGRGLSAAHEAGVVHRDFKPANVLRGRDGRIVVVDFGLARTDKRQPDPAESLVVGGAKPPSTLTGTGARIGTPGYMAPEQIRGGRGDERSDQFAFAVALWEALYDEHPFGVRAWPALAVAVVDGALHAPADPGTVPVALQRVLERALQTEPDARWPNLPAMLEQLREVGWPRKHRRIVLASAAAGSLALASAVGYFAAQDDVTPGCDRQADAHIAAIWSDVERERLGSRYEVTGQPHVAATWTFVQSRLDDWLAQWSRIQAETCGPVGEAMDPDLRRRRALCLDAALDSVNVLRVTMSELDPLAFANGDAGSMLSLADLSLCHSADAVSRRLPEPEAAREEIREVRAALAQGRVLAMARDPKASAVLDALPGRAEATGYPPLQAEVAYAQARLDGSEPALRDVVLAAERFGNDTVLARALIDLAARVDEDDDARHLLARAEAAVERAGAPMQLRVATAGQKADLALARGELDDALTRQEETLSIIDAAGMLGTPQHAWARLQLGNIRVAKGQYPIALEDLRAAVDIYEGALGPDHPEVAWALGPLADLHDTMQRPRQGDAVDTRIIALLRRTHPDLRHPQLGHAYYREAIRRFSAGESYPLAIEFAAEAVDVMSAALGRLHPATQKIRYYLARIRVATGSLEDADDDLAVLLERAEVLDERVKRVDGHGMNALVRARLGDRRGAAQALQAAADAAWADAALDPRLEQAVASAHLLEWSADVAEAGGAIEAALAYAELSWALWATLEHKHRDRSLHRSMTRAGRLRALTGFLPLATAPLTRVVERADSEASPRWPFVPDARFALAQVRLATGDVDHARRLAEQAHQGFVAVGHGRVAARDEVAAWIESLASTPEPEPEPEADSEPEPEPGPQ